MKFVDNLLKAHLKRYPAMQFADVYKLLHQAAMGNGHLVSMPDATERLLAELAQSGSGPEEPLFDPISPDGRIGRVHLRAFRALERDPRDLVAAFVRSTAVPPSLDKLQRYCNCLGDLALVGALPFGASELEDRLREVESLGYPTVHHSPPFKAAYKPAYRVVDREACGDWLPAQA